MEQHRFAHAFLGAPAAAVETALLSYLAPSGGYAHALEPDLRGPAPEPLSTAVALRILTETGRLTNLDSLLCYLSETSTPDGGLPARNPAAGAYPAASAVPPIPNPTGALQSTAPIAGILHRHRVQHPWLDQATQFCWTALESLTDSHPYELAAAVEFLDGTPDRSRAHAVSRRLGEQVRDRHLVVLDPDRPDDHPLPSNYPPGLYHYPYDYAPTPDSVARSWFTDAELDRALDFLAHQQENDGGWRMRFPEWAPGTRLEWRPILTVNSLLILRSYSRV
ncbi:MAG TPA: hypothetical protein VFV67_23100 [Actinophytocola sp.]|uniref:hypothetical protein n=1 Tax=Actinophytocola sp. TaxID=1872138 RepID=UPI002DBA59D8|nr:hypothetical protein [Actinophytocola sp.]HEU5473544.1 hypothetical protein [Actinophytocola sp.]